MAVPKKKKSYSRQKMRRSHHAIKLINVVVDPDSGEYKLPHHMCSIGKSYKGASVIIEKSKDETHKSD